MLEIDFHSLYCTPSIGGFPDCRQHSPPLRGRFSEERYFNIHSIFHSNRAFVKTKKFWVWLYWRGCQPLTTHWCDPTTDSHGDSWLLGFPPGPVRLSLDNLILFSSLKEAMLMQVLVTYTNLIVYFFVVIIISHFFNSFKFTTRCHCTFWYIVSNQLNTL